MHFDKVEPFARKGRKAAGLFAEMAGLPKVEPEVARFFFGQNQATNEGKS